MFVDTFIRRPILASVCSLVIILAGAIAIPTLPIAQFPELAPPQVAVTAFYNGANAETVETAVTNAARAGDQRRRGHAVHHLDERQRRHERRSPSRSTSTRNLDIAAVDVQNRLSQARGRLPNEVKQVGVIGHQGRRTTSCSAAAVYAEHNEYDTLFISNYVDRFVRDEIKRVPGVGDVDRLRRADVRDAALARSRQARRPQHHGRRGGRALREQNVQVAAGAGRVGAGARRGRRSRSACASAGRLTEPSEFENIILKRSADGALVRVKDVGRVELGAESYATASRYQRPRRRRLRRAAAADRERAPGVPATSRPRSRGWRSGSRPG